LQPPEHTLGKLGNLGGRLLRKHGMALTQIGSVGKWLRAHKEFVEDKSGRKHIGRWARCLGMTMALGGKVVCIKLIDNLSRYRLTALRPRTGKVKTCQAHPSVTAD